MIKIFMLHIKHSNHQNQHFFQHSHNYFKLPLHPLIKYFIELNLFN